MKDKTPKLSRSASGGIAFNPWHILVEAMKAVPVMRFALAVLGLVAVIAIVSAWRLDFKVAIFGSLVILGLMVILAFFARVTMHQRAKEDRDFLYYASVFFVCVFGLLITFTAVFLLTASAFRWPPAFHQLLFPDAESSTPRESLFEKIKKDI